MNAEDRSPPQRFELDTANEGAAAALRATAATLVVGGSVWLLSLGPGTVGTVVAILGLLAAVGWGAALLRSRQRITHRSTWYLELRDDGLTLAEGARKHQVGWESVTSVEVDEDRLVAVVARRTEGPLILEPRYRDQSVYALVQAVRERWPGATPRQRCAPHPESVE